MQLADACASLPRKKEVDASGGMEGLKEKMIGSRESGKVRGDPTAEDLRSPEGRMYAYGYDVFQEAKKAAQAAAA